MRGGETAGEVEDLPVSNTIAKPQSSHDMAKEAVCSCG